MLTRPGRRELPKRICIVPEVEAAGWANIGIGYHCFSNRHTHYTSNRVKALIEQGQLKWVGKHKKVATWTAHWTWAKVYTRNEAGEVFIANMQLVKGNRR